MCDYSLHNVASRARTRKRVTRARTHKKVGENVRIDLSQRVRTYLFDRHALIRARW